MNILIAEDERDIAFTYTKVLQDRGNKVTVTNDGKERIDAYRRESPHTPFDAVILDHKMPKKDGFQVAKEILSINPNERIIIASGYDREIFLESAERFHIYIEILQKPFSDTSLVMSLEGVKKK